VIIAGSYFGGATAVMFGTIPAPSFIVNSTTQITATSPAGTDTVDVTVIAPGGTTSMSSADRFTYMQTTPMITWSNPADITYGTALSSTQLDATASVPGNFTYTPAAGTVLDAGTNQSISVTFTPTDTTDYTTAATTVSINVQQAHLTVTADAKSKLYGQDDPALTATITGFVNGDTSSVVSGSAALSTTATASSPVGPYSITVAQGTLAAANYDFTTLNPGTLTVSKAHLTVAADAKTKLYGQDDPALTATVSGFVNGDTSSVVSGSGALSTTATAASPVGSYSITVSQGTLAATNYDFTTFNPGTLTVNKAHLTVTADNKMKLYGHDNPALTATVSGFVNGDTSSVVSGSGALSTTATATSPVGSYTITVAQGTLAAANYDFTTFNPSTLTVAQATPTITWSNPADITYGTALGSTQLDATASVPGTFVYTPASGKVLGAGTNQSLSVTFTPTDTTDYTTATSTVSINVLQATPTITWSNPADITYGTALGNTQLDATASVPGTFVYSPASGKVFGVGNNQSLSVTFTPTDTTDYTTATMTVSINVDKATPTITWSNPADITYGTDLGSTQLDATASVPGTFVYTPASGKVLGAGGNQSLSVTFTPTDTTDYAAATKTVSINVDKATPTITWSDPTDISYGTALGSTQLDATASVPGAFVYTPAAGTVLPTGSDQSLSVTFTPTDTTDYTTATSTVSINVDKATPTITWSNPADISYGTALGNTQLNATASVPGTFVYTLASGKVLSAGTNQSLSVTFTPTDTTDCTTATNTVSINVDKATPTITWSNPADISYGTALGNTQLNATASVPGTFVYTPVAGMVLPAGSNQSLSVTFTPTDTTDYTTATSTVSINVDKATPTLTCSDPADITYGTALGATQLNATASVPGTFVYVPAAGTVLPAGSDQSLSVTFTPTDTTDYTTMTETVSINVAKATPTLIWSNPADITYGTALGNTQLNATASVPGTFVYTPAAGTVLPAGSNQGLSVAFTPTDATDYTTATSTVSINVAQATPVVTTVGLYDPASSMFMLRDSNDSGFADQCCCYGAANGGMVPIVGDWTGDGVQSIGLYDPTTSTFYLRNTNDSGCADTAFVYGPANSKMEPIAGDWTGDGKDTVGLYDSANSTFYLRNTNDSGFADIVFNYGPANGAMLPLAGDWDGSGRDGIGLYNRFTSTFYLRETTTLQGPSDKGYADTTLNYGAPWMGLFAGGRRLERRWPRRHRRVRPGDRDLLAA